MEEQPSFDEPTPDAKTPFRRQAQEFVQRFVLVVGFGVAGAVVYMLLIGPRDLVGLSNGLFVAGVVFLIVGLMPLFSNLFGRATVPFRLEEDEGFEQVLEEERARRERYKKQYETLTFLFGGGGILVVLLSLIISFIAQ